jgi:hypothetical protein
MKLLLALPTACWVVLLMSLTSGCVTSSGSGGGASSGGSVRGGVNPVIARLDGKEIRTDELLKSPILRQALRQWAAIEHIKYKAAAAGVKVDKAKVQEQLDTQRAQVEGGGMSWDDMLAAQGMSNDEVYQMFEFQNLMSEYAKFTAGSLSDDEVESEWERQSDYWRQMYVQMNHLPDSRTASLTFDEVKDWLRDQLVEQKAMAVQQTIFDDAINSVKLELPALGDAATQAEWAKRIIMPKESKPADELPAPDNDDNVLDLLSAPEDETANESNSAEVEDQVTPEDGTQAGSTS